MAKKRGIPECILLVTQRMTKYPLLIDAIVKTTKGNFPWSHLSRGSELSCDLFTKLCENFPLILQSLSQITSC